MHLGSAANAASAQPPSPAPAAKPEQQLAGHSFASTADPPLPVSSPALHSASAMALRRALGQAARMLGVRAESTIAAPAAAAAASSKLAGLSEVSLPSSDPIMQPYYQQIAEMEVYSAASPREASESERAVSRRRRRLPAPPPCLRARRWP